MPQKLKSSVVDSTVDQELQRLCKLSGTVRRLGNNSHGIAGFYYIQSSKTENKFFIKVVHRIHLLNQIRANKIASYLKERKISVITLLPGFPKPWRNDYYVFLYPWVEAGLFDIKKHDITKLGEAVGQLHIALKDLPWRGDVKKASDERVALIYQSFGKIINKQYQAGPNASLVRSICQKYSADFLYMTKIKQVIHGDLNIGNLLFTESEIFFLDFEDTKHSYLPVSVDVALVLERFLLLFESNDREAFSNAIGFLQGYITFFKGQCFKENELKRTLIWLIIRTFCLLNMAHYSGQAWPDTEWQKYFFLFDHWLKRKDLLDEIGSWKG